MGRALDDISLRLWLALVNLGGYWSVRELREGHFPLLTAQDIRPRLASLADHGMVKARQQHRGKHPLYGVTTTCTAPPGYDYAMSQPPADTEAAP